MDVADLRRCIGSARFGIVVHDAPVADFPVQPSQRDGLGRMCKLHWNQYTAALRKEAATAKTEAGADEPEPIEAKPSRAKTKTAEAIEESAEAGTT
jgi:hypothetical protein